MTSSCTLFAVTDDEMQRYGDEITANDLPAYSSSVSKISSASRDRTLALGTDWQPLHLALARYQGLDFLAAGGTRVVALDDGPRSSGRHFTPAQTASILRALEDISDRDLPRPVHRTIAKVQSFLADAVARGHGIIVYLFS